MQILLLKEFLSHMEHDGGTLVHSLPFTTFTHKLHIRLLKVYWIACDCVWTDPCFLDQWETCIAMPFGNRARYPFLSSAGTSWHMIFCHAHLQSGDPKVIKWWHVFEAHRHILCVVEVFNRTPKISTLRRIMVWALPSPAIHNSFDPVHRDDWNELAEVP